MSDHTFVPGEVAVYQNLHGPYESYNGTECVVDSHLIWADENDDSDAGFGYDVTDDMGEWFAYFYQLRKKRPPEEPVQTRCESEVTV